MFLNSLQHYLLRPKDLELSKKFYMEILGLTLGPRPKFSIHGYWLYLQNIPVVHLIETTNSDTENHNIPTNRTTGPLDHIAFHANDIDQMIAHLETNKIPMQLSIVPEEGNTKQIFIEDPDGVRIELNFSAK